MRADLFLSGSDDGLVRQTDIRQPLQGGSSHPNEATSASDSASIVGAQPQSSLMLGSCAATESVPEGSIGEGACMARRNMQVGYGLC